MKIISWNVNGLRAAMKKSLAKYIAHSRADIFCIQEVKTKMEFEVEGYQQYWNHAEQVGYAGVLTLTRVQPISVNHDLGEDDLTAEGRMLSLEYESFYLVNVYYPNTWYKPERLAYRLRWEEAFHAYLDTLKKPVILCGDFNVAYLELDSYPDSARAKMESEGFQQIEIENMHKLLHRGYVDAFRYLYPSKEGAYTCWSNRNGLRTQNHGSRIDYFLVCKQYQHRIAYVKHITSKMGSDHCPIVMDIRLSFTDALSQIKQEEHFTPWEDADWEIMEDELLELQKSISKAAYIANWDKVKLLQMQLVRSEAAKMLAVKLVSEVGSQPGIDGVKWETPEEKRKAAESLDSKDYRAQPSKTILFDDGKEKIREMHLPIMRDRAMQKLYSFALDPVAEATADRKSFAFRKGRSMMDVHTYLCRMLKQPGIYCVVKADVKSCYDDISQKWLLDNVKMDTKVLREFLQSGTVKGGELFQTNRGIAQGASLSTILGNIVLDGLQKYIYSQIHGEEVTDYPDGDLIRYADDMIISVRRKETADKILSILREFLKVRGLRLNEDKTCVCDLEQGFDFLSRSYRKVNEVLIVMPSEKAVNGFLRKLENTINSFEGSQKSLIDRLNRMLSGWGNYHRITDAYHAFKLVDSKVTTLLMIKMRELHPKLSKEKILEKYWYRADVDEYYFTLEHDRTVRVMHLANLPIVRHQAVATSFNPYCDDTYMQQLSMRREIQKQSTDQYKAIWKRQGGKCYYCGETMYSLQWVKLVEKILGEGYKPSNLAYIHVRCENMELEEVESVPDLAGALSEATKPYDDMSEGYAKLQEHFRTQTKSPFTLSFREIEKIMGMELPPEAREDENFWHDKAASDDALPISLCWTSQEFRLQRVHLDREDAIFCKTAHRMKGLRIPDKLLKYRIPVDAAFEAEQFFKYLIKKYNL